MTRPEPEDGPLSRRLRERGASVVHLPSVRIGPPSDPAPMRAARDRLEPGDWLVFTSARAVEAFGSRADGEASPSVAAVGPATADAARGAGWRITVVGSGGGARGLAETLVDRGVGAGSRVLVPVSDRAGDALPTRLATEGADVVVVEAYRTVPDAPDLGAAERLAEIDAITFTSPSAVEGWACAAGGEPRAPVRPNTPFVAIGRTTARRLSEVGVSDPVVAPEESLAGLVDAVCSLYGRTAP